MSRILPYAFGTAQLGAFLHYSEEASATVTARSGLTSTKVEVLGASLRAKRKRE
jgi:hypothetical protein